MPIWLCPGPSPGAQVWAPVSQIDIAPTVLYWMGLPVPADMDGRPLEDIMTPEHVAAHTVSFGGDAALDVDLDRREYDAEEEEEKES